MTTALGKHTTHLLLKHLSSVLMFFFLLANIQTIESSTPVELESLRNETSIPIYSQILIWKDSLANATFESVKKSPALFQANQTQPLPYNIEDVYWCKIQFQGDPDQATQSLLMFSSNQKDRSWQQIETWLVNSKDSIIYQQTGDQFENDNKPIPSPNNFIAINLDPTETLTLFVKLNGQNKNNLNGADKIQFYLLNKNWTGFFEPYRFDGAFPLASRIVNTNPIITHQIWVDSKQDKSIEQVLQNEKNIDWQPYNQVKHQVDQVYWIKKTFIGSPSFNGVHYFHISVAPNLEEYSFDYMDIYQSDRKGGIIHQRAGDQIPMRQRPVRHWMNFVKLELAAQDTIDVFIRLAGADARYLMPGPMMMYHVDKENLFEDQLTESTKAGIYYGILSLQFLFFLLLFLIEKEWIHFYFSLIILGFFLSIGFGLHNYTNYLPFERFRTYQYPLHVLGLFTLSIGMLKFTERYFNYAKDSLFSKYIIPTITLVYVLVCVNTIRLFELNTGQVFFTETLHNVLSLVLAVIAVVFVLIMSLIAPKQKAVSKKYFIISLFLPVFVGLFYVFNFLIDSLHILDIADRNHLSVLDLLKLSVIASITLLALTIGDRNNKLKEDKAKALNDHITDQQEINQVISKFVPNAFLSALGKQDIREINLGDNIEKKVSVLFTDIRNYTGLSEVMSPEENFGFVNAYNRRMGPIIQKNNGFINQYLGDGIMALFPGTTDDALQAALEMHEAIKKYNHERKLQNRQPISVGMGLHTGPLIMGITGDENRMDAAIISDTVNTASRIEQLTKTYTSQILLSEASYLSIAQPNTFNFQFIDEVIVAGKKEKLRIYALEG